MNESIYRYRPRGGGYKWTIERTDNLQSGCVYGSRYSWVSVIVEVVLKFIVCSMILYELYGKGSVVRRIIRLVRPSADLC